MQNLVKEPVAEATTVEAPQQIVEEPQLQTYMTFEASVEDGEIVLPAGIELAEGTPLLVTILQDKPISDEPDHMSYTDEELENMTLGEQIIAGLKDVIAGRGIRVTNEKELEAFLDSLEED